MIGTVVLREPLHGMVRKENKGVLLRFRRRCPSDTLEELLRIMVELQGIAVVGLFRKGS